MLRRLSVLSLLILAAIVTMLAMSRTGVSRVGVAHAASHMRFGGEPDDNFWQLDVTYCRDGIKIAYAQQTLSTDGVNLGLDHAHFSIQLGAADPAVNVVLPFPITQGDGSAMVADGTTNFLFNTSQVPGTPAQITVQRWDHGHNTYLEPDDNSTDTDHSQSDDLLTDSGSVVEDCYIQPPTATPTNTITATPTGTATASATPTSTVVPTVLPTNTPVPSATPTVIPTSTSTSTQTPAPTVTATTTATLTPAEGVVFAAPPSPRILAVQASMNLATAGGRGSVKETLKLFVPAGATDSDLTVRVVALGSLPPGVPVETGPRGTVGLGYAFALSATSAHGQPVSRFNTARPLLLQLAYDPTDLQGIDPGTLRLSFFDSADHSWHDLPTTVDTYHHILCGKTDHFTLFQVRGVTHTQARLQLARARLNLLAAAGPPRLLKMPVSRTALAGMPLDLALPEGRQHAPVSVAATGAPGARLRVTFTLAGVAIMQTLALDAQGYATTAFAPPLALTSPARLQVAAVVSLRGSSYARAGTVILLPGNSTGPLPSGAPPLWATLASSFVRAQTVHPLLVARTAPGLAVSATLAKAGKPIAGLAVATGTADRQGVARLRLPLLPRALLAGGKSQTLRVVVTVAWRGQSSQQILALTVGP